MPYAVEVYFDLPAEAAIRPLWQQLETEGIPITMLEGDARPHVSLVVANEIDQPALTDAVRHFAATHAPIPLRLGDVRTFPGDGGVVYLAVESSAELRRLHTQAWDAFDAMLKQPSAYYQPALWLPHSTITFGVAKPALAGVINACRRMSWPEVVTGAFIGMVRATPDHLESLTRFDLAHQAV